MLSKNISEMLNEQITKELYSAYLYQDIANYYSERGLKGFANWFSVQAGEELDHALKINGYLIDEGIKPVLAAIDAPSKKYADDREPLAAAYEHEQYITASVNAIFKAADEADDYRTKRFLGWFIDEQAEEEKNAAELVTEYDLFGSDCHGLYLLDSKLKERK